MPGDPDLDSELLIALRDEIYKRAGGEDALKTAVPSLIRQAIDEVIDAPRTGRLLIDQLEKTEKTYIGTKVEILLRKLLGFPKGILDLVIAGHDVDIKNTVTGNWMIPLEAVDKVCLLVASDERTARCRLGLIVTRDASLTRGANRDSKRSISSLGIRNVLWLLHDHPYPPNFWEGRSPETITRILRGRSGTERLVTLFRELQGIPISRQIIEAVAQQRDYMKRLRKNGGARDHLASEDIVLLSGAYHQDLISAFALPDCLSSEFISFAVTTPDARRLAKERGAL